MTTATFFTASASASMGQPSAVRPLARKTPAGTSARPATTEVATRAAYPWMTQTMLGKLSARARRLMRADY
ncbi:hypothetical protein [Polaromonas sp.]|uniref:hypothetical protein n=1 Tax=Polaromonas sp. TaxID=1869339 RepID=UPI00375082D3